MKLKGKVVNNYGVILHIELTEPIEIEEGQELEIKTVNESEERKTFKKLLGLWELLLAECSKSTGYSKEWWKWELKMRAGFGQVVDGPKGTKRFIPQSMAWDDSIIKDRSKLFKKSFNYLMENEVIDLTEFNQRYYQITKRELVC